LATQSTASPDAMSAMPLDLFFDYLGLRLDPGKAEGKTVTLNWIFPDVNERYVLSLENCVLNHTPNKQVADADATITLSREVFNQVIMKQAGIPEKVGSGEIKIEGNAAKIQELFSLLDTFDGWFNIVTP
jgi:alkyl sulfatase BDS1-like metallo-beta-lactamase superfamily hydrolase